MKILVIDNYDSFTYNLVYLVHQVIGETGTVSVFRNDKIELSEARRFDKIVIGPGPGIPEEAGIILPLIRELRTTHSILGVCLGHQAIVEAYGGTLRRLDTVFHGVETKCYEQKRDDLFDGISKQYDVGRYHSWAVQDCPSGLEVIAEDDEGIIMGVRHRVHRIRGVQFHPESILTPDGYQMIHNYINNDRL